MNQFSVAHHQVEEAKETERVDITLRFKNVKDRELLLIEIDLLLESMSECGWILDHDEEENE